MRSAVTGLKKKILNDSTPFSRRGKKQPLENKLKERDDTKPIVPLHRRNTTTRPKQFLTNCLYMVNLALTMKFIIPFYWDAGKSIIDFTAGKRIIWKKFPYNHLSPCGYQHWHVDFNDISYDVDAEYHIPVEEIDNLPQRYDIGVFDPPFTELKNGVESFGVRAKTLSGRIKTGAHNPKSSREFYFRNFTPLDQLFKDTWEPINKVCDNLVIKIGDSHKNKQLIDNETWAILNFDHTHNKNSEFRLIDKISYRGNYARRGGRFPFAQSVTSYYLVFKKDPDSR